MVTSDGRYELRWDPAFKTLSFKDRQALQTIWAALVRSALTPPVRLLIAGSGELQLEDAAGQRLWSSNTRGAGRPPHALQILDGSLRISDSTGATTWLANATCPAGTRLEPWAACGGAVCPGGSPHLCRDAPHQGTCCPTGWQCQRQSAARWWCAPTAALGRCSGARTIATGAACGGTAACGLDAPCTTTTCCVAGSVCQRLGSARWECVAVPPRPGPPPRPPGMPPPQSRRRR
jgi:hypothetical protein